SEAYAEHLPENGGFLPLGAFKKGTDPLTGSVPFSAVVYFFSSVQMESYTARESVSRFCTYSPEAITSCGTFLAGLEEYSSPRRSMAAVLGCRYGNSSDTCCAVSARSM